MEPGRSIVADAGMTIYTVGTVKTIPGYKNYVSIDGGMTDNPRFALYGSEYTVLLANKVDEKAVGSNLSSSSEKVIEAYWAWGISKWATITPDIQFYIDRPGGSISASIAIYDTIQYIK